LFIVTDSDVGDILRVGDISGTPIFLVNSNGYVKVTTSVSSGQTSTEDLLIISETSGTSLFADYAVENTSTNKARAGQVMAIWSTASVNVEYTEVATNDLDRNGGDTSGITFSVVKSGTDIILRATISAGTWNIKTAVRVL